MGHQLMEFRFTDEQDMIADTARSFFAEHATSERTRAAMAHSDGIDPALWQALGQELGLTGIALPEAHGGAGLGMVELAILAEAAGYHVAALPLLSVAVTGRGIEAGGTDAQKAEWLPRIVSGDVIATAGGATDVTADGNRLSGTVDMLTHGAAASLFLIAGQSGAWLVPVDAKGVTVTPLTTMDQTRPFARLSLDNVEGDPLADAKAAIDAGHEGGWICLAAEALGGAQACLDRTVAYAKERIQFGRPIGSFQAYKHRLADMMIAIEEARSAVYWAACAVDERSEDANFALHAAKSLAADVYFKCAGDMIQLHGGIGFTWEHDAHLYFKRARAIQTLSGTGAQHREAIARMILGKAA